MRPASRTLVTWQRILNERGWAAPHWPQGIRRRRPRHDGTADSHGGDVPRAGTAAAAVQRRMLGPGLLKFGTAEQLKSLPAQAGRLDLWFCQGFSEPGSGSDLASLRTRAVRDGESTSSTARRSGPLRALADWIFALVRTKQARKQEGISFLLIDMMTPGVTVRPNRLHRRRASPQRSFFDNAACRWPISSARRAAAGTARSTCWQRAHEHCEHGPVLGAARLRT